MFCSLFVVLALVQLVENVENGGVSPPGGRDENWARGVTGSTPPLKLYSFSVS